jgi:hypothetical protein
MEADQLSDTIEVGNIYVPGWPTEIILQHKPLHSFHRLLETATISLSHLINQLTSPTIKIDYMRFKIIPILLYTTVSSKWTLAQYRKLDVRFFQHYRKILYLPDNSPAALLHLPQFMAGIELLVLDCKSL